MKRWPTFMIAALLVVGGLALVRHSNEAAAQTDAGWTTLFDGKNLNNFNAIGNANWKTASYSPTAATAFWFRKTPIRISSSGRNSGSIVKPTAAYTFAAPTPTR